jgi:hypothetical protein
MHGRIIVKRADLERLATVKVLEAANLSNAEARFLVSDYYQFQEMRKRADMQQRHLGDKELPALLRYTADSAAHMETQIVRALRRFAESKRVGQWCLAQTGVGPVITAGLLAHIDIERAPTAGHIWSFAGLNPARQWKKGEKRPFNRALKQVCWHAGQCFKRCSGDGDAIYGQIYRARKELLVRRNEAGDYAERATVYTTKSAEVKKSLAQGRLPAGNLDSQACRFATKMFLSHLHAVWYWDHFGTVPPKPFAIAILGHAHDIVIPNMDTFPGLEDAYYGKKAA